MPIFYVIDGPLKDTLLMSLDFRPTEHERVIYHKHTLAMRSGVGVIYTDIASVEKEPKEMDITDNIPVYIRAEKPLTLKPVSENGKIEGSTEFSSLEIELLRKGMRHYYNVCNQAKHPDMSDEEWIRFLEKLSIPKFSYTPVRTSISGNRRSERFSYNDFGDEIDLGNPNGGS